MAGQNGSSDQGQQKVSWLLVAVLLLVAFGFYIGSFYLLGDRP